MIPGVGAALLGWFQPVTFGVITKTTVNFEVVETAVDTEFMGVVQPLSLQKLQIKPIGQRDWIWLQVHAMPSLILKPDDLVTYQEQRYRVESKYDYKMYQYIEYHLIEDYVA